MTVKKSQTEHVDILFHFHVAVVKPEIAHVLVCDVFQCHRCRHVGGVPVKRFDEATSQLDRRQL